MSSLKVSVVMPVYNRGAILKGVIEGLLAQTYSNIEFILVDDGSTDNTASVIQSFPQVKYVYRPNGGCAAARNTGISNATGDVVLFIDSDVFCPPHLAEVHAAFHTQNNRWIVQGQLVRIIKLEDAYKVPFSMVHYSRSFFDTANVSVRREHLLAVGGFDEVNFKKGWEDLDLGLRLIKKGIKPKRLVTEAYVWHYEGDYSQEAVLDFFEDRYREGRASVLFYRKYPTFSVRMMTMIGPEFFLLNRLLFNENYLRSKAYYQKIKKLIDLGKIGQALAKVRVDGYCFHFKGIQDKIKEDGFVLKPKR